MGFPGPRGEAVNGRHRPSLNLLFLYPELLGTYGDRGNLAALVQRARWRGIDANVTEASLGDRIDVARFDLVLVGGGQDRAQRAVADDLRRYKGPALVAAIEADCPVLAVCGGYQLLGRFYRTAAGEELPGLGVFDAWTEAGTGRLTGDVAVRATFNGAVPDPAAGNRASSHRAVHLTLVGFENHSGRTWLGRVARPLGRVLHGYGNNGRDGTEGLVYRRAVGTYLHGSLLPKNPGLTDWLLQAALDRRYRDAVRLTPLDDTAENRARTVMLRRMLGPVLLRRS